MDFNKHVSLSALLKKESFQHYFYWEKKNYFILFLYCHITANIADIYDSERWGICSFHEVIYQVGVSSSTHH